jgi:hypothetical protein
MMERNAQAIQSAAWRKASCRIDDVALTVNKVTESDGVYDKETGRWNPPSTYTAWLQDRFDCFLQGGDGVMELGTMCGYAGMVAYRFALPTVRPGAIDDIKLLIQRDRYLRAGVRVAVEINNSDTPSNDWQVLRGENEGAIASPTSPSGGVVGVASWGFLHQYDIPHLVASRAWEGTLEFTREDFPKLNAAASAKYLWVYMSPEDFCSYWSMYNTKEQRYYTIEGSASLLSGCCTFAFATDAVAPEQAEGVSSADASWVYRGDGVASIASTSRDEAGNFYNLYGRGGVVVSSSGAPESILAVMNASANSGKIITDDLFGFDPAVEIGALGKFCALSNVGIDNKNVPFVSYMENDGDADNAYTQADGVISAHRLSRLAMGVASFNVPASRESYTKVRFRFSKKAGFRLGSGSYVEKDCDFVSHGVEGIRFNLWKSSSLAFHGIFANVAKSALASKTEFFTGNAATVNGEIVGVGGYAEGVTVSAEASLIANFAWDEIAAGEDNEARYFELPADCKIGDVLLLAPQIRTLAPVPLWKVGYEENGYCEGCCWFYGVKFASSGMNVPGSMAVAPYAMGAIEPGVYFK